MFRITYTEDVDDNIVILKAERIEAEHSEMVFIAKYGFGYHTPKEVFDYFVDMPVDHTKTFDSFIEALRKTQSECIVTR